MSVKSGRSEKEELAVKDFFFKKLWGEIIKYSFKKFWSKNIFVWKFFNKKNPTKNNTR